MPDAATPLAPTSPIQPTVAEPSITAEEPLVVRGARVHNLKNITVAIPYEKLTVITGVSGSGKSSLAFDTLYAEGYRRYVESLSAYARQFLERLPKPDVDEISGICPSIAVQQKNQTRQPRSTVATQTEIYDYLRLLYARAGEVYCLRCGGRVRRDTPQSVCEDVLRLPEGARFYVSFPLHAPTNDAPPTAKAKRLSKKQVADTRLQTTAHLMSLLQRGFRRLLVNGQPLELNTPDDFPNLTLDGVEVIVDRLVVRPDVASRLADSVEMAFREGHGDMGIHVVSPDPIVLRYGEAFACKACQLAYPIPEPSLFSFNNPYGACPTCQGFGSTIGMDLAKVIPDAARSLAEGAVDAFEKPQLTWAKQELLAACQRHGIPWQTPFRNLTAEQKRLVIEGEPRGEWGGIRGVFDWLETKKYKLHARVLLARYRGYTTCPDCGGSRLRREARAVQLGGRDLPSVTQGSIREALAWFTALPKRLTQEAQAIASPLLDEITSRLRFLSDVGLDYLTLDRMASTLSGGEAQRIQLATHLGSAMTGALYVLDEPSVGLHPRDTARLVASLEQLRDSGNTVVVVEHDEATIRAADYIVDIGPGAGEQGGTVVFQGAYPDLLQDRHSLTAAYLRGDERIPIPTQRRSWQRAIQVRGAAVHNLKHIDVTIPLDVLTCVTGVSGSGKSTLIHAVLCPALGSPEAAAAVCASLAGSAHISGTIVVDQSPIGRSSRSNPATYLKAYDAIREVFAQTPEARRAGLSAGHFSFNVPGGRCETCQGAGAVTIEMQFLADVELPCETCNGLRFTPEVLAVHFRGKTIHDVLQMTVREALAHFDGIRKVTERLRVLDDVGLGYLRLGQPATTLSGGEAQRLKLAAHLSEGAGPGTLFVFDEPTTGLHFADVAVLLRVFDRLLAAGASLVVIEHNLDVIKTADWVIDLGPEGGESGGEVVAVGTPEMIAAVEASHTGRFLRTTLSRP
ncbi:MAG: excinuclease ABC subunit UvrA [Chloracidobacterium sp.]|uniref:UvrABC system protein A n=1 Tax=Chloracidobacterium validum TaxID=2821543 RepID=A0ABX8B5T5_9BACT|nr:excinuclease ABC subunit UvrA [Chloracidobacterium validum]QUW02334.1 excinuclease ABC subunit UvrA [Chloracidobacterium validum]